MELNEKKKSKKFVALEVEVVKFEAGFVIRTGGGYNGEDDLGLDINK